MSAGLRAATIAVREFPPVDTKYFEREFLLVAAYFVVAFLPKFSLRSQVKTESL